MASPNSQKPQGLPNPYAPRGLPNPYASATVAAAAPVRYSEEQAKAEQQKKTPAFHNPHGIKRPQPKKAGAMAKKPSMPAVLPTSTVASAAAPAPAAQQHGIDYYLSTADDDAAILEERRQRQHDEKQRKKEKKKFEKQYGHWNPHAPYSIHRPTNLQAYIASGGWARKKKDFEEYLRQAAEKQKQEEAERDVPDAPRPSSPGSASPQRQGSTAKMSFAPPSSYDPANALSLADEDAGEEAFARRMQMSHPPPPPPPPPAPATGSYTDPGTAVTQSPYQATISAPPVRYAHATISAPPVRYERPDVPMEDVHDAEPEERPNKRPKLTAAQSIMAKMGYKEGQGLGKNSDGVTTHLEVKMRKQTQGANMFDEDGGKIKSQQVWDVRGGLRAQKEEPGKFGEESSVVVAWGCVEGIDWDENAQRDDGGIRQDMGEVFSAKFGPVQQVHLDENSKDGAVYIKFESVLSALNAVNRFDEGFEFRGRRIRAHYYDERKFHAGVWEH